MKRFVLISMLLCLLAGSAFAQETTTTTTAATATTTAATTTTAEEAPADTEEAPPARRSENLREELTTLLRRHPSEVGRILALDPLMLSNDPFLARYPDLAEFVAKHPELRRNPHYYVSNFDYYPPPRQSQPFEQMMETLSIAAIFFLFAVAGAWLIRTIIEQKRWNRLSKTQVEFHGKILDRFGSSQEVLDYVKSAAGTKFLESAPIPVRSEPPVPQSPLSRIMRSIQLGIIVTAGAIGALLVSLRFDGDGSAGFFAMGVIAFSIGIGFIGSAVVSLKMSRRLGLSAEAAVADEDVR